VRGRVTLDVPVCQAKGVVRRRDQLDVAPELVQGRVRVSRALAQPAFT
jgi:hypothetical protein